MKLASAMLAVSLLAGCGTVMGSRQNIGFDSEPRGVTVATRKFGYRQPLGTTPLVATVDRRRTIAVEVGDGEEASVKKFRCGYRWFDSILPNSLVTLAGLANPAWFTVGAAFFATDLLTENMYECKETLKIKAADAEPVENGPCYRYVTFPPAHDRDSVADELAEDWRALARDRLGPCDKIIYNDEVRSQLSFYNLTSRGSETFEHLRSDQLLEFGAKFRATHLVFLDYEVQGDTVVLEPRVYDIVARRFDTKAERQLSARIQKRSLQASVGKSDLMSYSLNFFPNSVTYSLTSYVNDAEPKPPAGYFTKETRTIATLPTYVANLGLTTVEHPRGYRVWDFVLAVYPSLFTSYLRKSILFADEEEKSTDAATDPSLEARRLTYEYTRFVFLPSINFGPTVHTPLGAIGIHLTTGPMLSTFSDSEQNSSQLATWTIGARLFYQAFLTENIFFLMNIQSFSPNKKQVDTLYIKESEGLSSADFAFGYFFPTARQWLHQTVAGY